ncbi:hypothetical protein ACK8HX_06615 [Oryzobacter sp. R7]
MTTYAIAQPGVEDQWGNTDPEEGARVHAEHGRFSGTLGVRACLTNEEA